MKSQREPAQQRPLRLEAPSRSAPSKGSTICQRVRSGRARLHGDRPELPAGQVWIRARKCGASWGLSSATRGRDQDGMRSGGGMESSVPGRGTRGWGEGAPRPGTQAHLTGTAQPPTDAPYTRAHWGEGSTPGPPGALGREGSPSASPRFQLQLRPKLDARRRFSSTSPHVVHLWASAPLDQLPPLYISRELLQRFHSTYQWPPTCKGLSGRCTSYREKKIQTEVDVGEQDFSSRDTCEPPSCFCPRQVLLSGSLGRQDRSVDAS